MAKIPLGPTQGPADHVKAVTGSNK